MPLKLNVLLIKLNLVLEFSYHFNLTQKFKFRHKYPILTEWKLNIKNSNLNCKEVKLQD